MGNERVAVLGLIIIQYHTTVVLFVDLKAEMPWQNFPTDVRNFLQCTVNIQYNSFPQMSNLFLD